MLQRHIAADSAFRSAAGGRRAGVRRPSGRIFLIRCSRAQGRYANQREEDQPLETEQVALGILTIAASGVVSGVVTFRLNSGRDARRMRREKLERLFLAHTAFVGQLGVSWFPYMKVMDGSISYNDALDMTIKREADRERHLETIEMLVALYFPELSRGLEELTAIRDVAAATISAHKEAYKRVGPHPTKALEKLKNSSIELDEHTVRFRSEMAKLAQALGARSKYAA